MAERKRARLAIIAHTHAAIALLLLLITGARTAGDSRISCRGSVESDAPWDQGRQSAPRSEALERAKALPGGSGAVMVRAEERPRGWEGGTFENDWRVGPFTAYESGSWHRARYPSSVRVGLTEACDDRTIVHDGYYTDHLEVRHDPAKDVWYLLTLSHDGSPRVATPLRIVDHPGTRFVASRGFTSFLMGAIVLGLATILLLRSRRHAANALLDEVRVHRNGQAASTEGIAFALTPAPAPGSVVLAVASPAAQHRALDPYRRTDAQIPASWIPSTQAHERRAAAKAFLASAALSLFAGAIAILALARP